MNKVLFLINSLDGGGAEKALVDLVNNINSREFEVTVMTLCDKGIYKNQLNDNIKYLTMSNFSNIFIEKVIVYSVQFLLPPELVYRFFIRGKYDIEIAFLEGAPVKILASSTNKKSKKLTWIHSDMENDYQHFKLFKSIKENRDCYRKFDKIICVSENAKDAFSRKFSIEKNVFVQYNVIDNELIKKRANEKCNYRFSKFFKIITVGRLVPSKGYGSLLKACKKLLDEGFRFELIILGDGSERGKIEKIIKDNNLDGVVKLLGFKKNPYKYMKNCDLFVSSSKSEGFSLVVAEALILGLPVLSTDCAGPNELLKKGEYGMIVENSVGGIVSGMKKIIYDKNLYNHYKAQAAIRGKSFEKDRLVKDTEKIILNGECR